MLKIGITGGIGSGKSTLCRMFEKINIPVYYSDNAARFYLNYDSDVKDKIRNTFGDEMINGDTVNREKLAKFVFDDQEELKKLNSIMHPVISADFDNWLKNKNNCKYIIIESAILFESGTYKKLDKIVSVVANETIRISRVKKRDSVKTEDVLNRIKAQLSDDERIQRSDLIVMNNCNLETVLLDKVYELDHIFRKEIENKKLK